MRLTLLFCMLMIALSGSAAQNDKPSVAKDSTAQKKGNSALKVIFSGKPGRAFAYSLLVPGGGQIYNKKWWKLPIVYGALGFTFYLVDFNTRQYRRYDDAFRMRVDLGDRSNDEFAGIYSLSALNVQRKYFDKNLQRSYLAIIGVYLLSGMDAFVDRHFMNFDVSEDLSLRITPQAGMSPCFAGIGLCLYPRTHEKSARPSL